VKEAYKIGTVETLRVNRSGRRLYLNLDAFTVQAHGIEAGDLLRVRIEEGYRPEATGTLTPGRGKSDTFQKRSHFPEKEEVDE